jgi:hypothetical protein
LDITGCRKIQVADYTSSTVQLPEQSAAVETEVGNAGRIVNTGTSSINSEYVIFYLFLVNIIGNCHENKYI